MIARSEAEAILKAAEASRERSKEIYRYNRFSPYFYIWGAAWTVAYCICAVNPDLFEPVMPISIGGAVLSSAVFSAVRSEGHQRIGRRVAASFLVMWIFT